ncbi:MAG TPA: Gfo/Idh/MocA family oxidoreductase [Chthonomonadaceae bacterium]|nr:Gfo/Idh/MocA family oxidoreductase [Chthonomonadaceae bacterium]
MERKINIGLVGGGFARAFQFHEHPGCTVTAVAELNPERREQLRTQFHCDTAYETLEELLRDKKVEAVGIFTPAPEHARHSILALEAGKHVLSAVPAAFSLEECEWLLHTVRATGLTYMMAETSYYRRETMHARNWYQEGKFGELFHSEGEYWHESLETLMFDVNGKPTWRYGLPPMHYPTHSTAFLIGVTGERLTRVQCIGWGDDHPILKDNVYANPFWNEIAFFQTDRGHSSRMIVGWHVGHPEVERASWYGSQFSFVMASPMGQSSATSKSLQVQTVEVSNHYESLPEPLRHPSGHGGSHTHLTHEFISALQEGRRPTIDIYEALAYTAPGIVAHQSALKGGETLPVPDFGRA